MKLTSIGIFYLVFFFDKIKRLELSSIETLKKGGIKGMRKESKPKTGKRGLLAVLATGAAVGIGVGAKVVVTHLKAKREAKREAESLQALEDERFGED